jgi:hypothetical protein
MIPSLLDSVCRTALHDYLNDPWRWPRETDLVVDLVGRIRSGLPEGERQVPANLRNLGNTLQDAQGGPRRIPRVRTELKLGDDGLRVDIGVFRSRTVDCFLNREGARDVSLKANAGDMEGLLEVKLFPDLYLFRDEQPCKWFGDVLKLGTLAPDAVRGALLLDTSLPLEQIGVTYSRRRGATELARVDQSPSLPPWPLRPGPFSVEVGHRMATFEPTDAPQHAGLYLWALAADRSWTPAFGGVLGRADVNPYCWTVRLT